jgi:hypothetical protein
MIFKSCSIIDFDNTEIHNRINNNYIHQNNKRNASRNAILNNNEDFASDDDIPLLENENENNNNNARNTYSRTSNNLTLPINSSLYRNNVIKQLYWNMFLIIIMSGIGLLLTGFSYVETVSSKGIDIYNIDVEYLYYYFFILLLFYAFYIASICIILMITFCKNLDIKSFGFPLLLNNVFFQIHFILRILVISLLTVRMIDNTPLTNININNTGATKTDNIPVYLPKHIQYMIIETIIYGYNSHVIGISTGVIKILIGY